MIVYQEQNLSIFHTPTGRMTRWVLNGDVQISVAPSSVQLLPSSTSEPRLYVPPNRLHHFTITHSTVPVHDSSLQNLPISAPTPGMLEVTCGSAATFGTSATILSESTLFPLLKVLPGILSSEFHPAHALSGDLYELSSKGVVWVSAECPAFLILSLTVNIYPQKVRASLAHTP